MQASSGILIIAIGLIILYLAVTGRYKCLTNLIACISGASCSCASVDSPTNTQGSVLAPLIPLYPK